MKFRQIKEGEIRFFIPTGRKYDADVFYNEDAELTRDISVSALQAFQKSSKKKLIVCDALSASGARGLRYAKEVNGLEKVILNDRSPSAAKLIKKNITLNKLQKKCVITNEDASLLLRKNIFGVIDLDPFGPPVQFLDSAAKAAFHKGFVAITATDTSALSGAYPEACLRKYGIRSIRTEFYNELGIRILISSIILAFAKYNKAFVPVLSFPYQHYYRVFGRIEHESSLTRLLDEFKYVNYCECGERSFGEPEIIHKNHKCKTCGPIYLGPINNTPFIEDVLADMRKRDFKLRKEGLKLLDILRNETELFYYDLHHLAKLNKRIVPKFDKIIENLNKKGFRATKTVFSDKSIRTNVNLKEVLKQLK
ncbi:MAG: tRNA (guanine(10)-N(2))-dimethyltransferase [Candidatus Aenigmarchaeota archaeon]|nr:tRNA (guanine(10)-N(2))-dimethyltransferase [Candidatus Aenigmarchaeota archaeon]